MFYATMEDKISIGNIVESFNLRVEAMFYATKRTEKTDRKFEEFQSSS